MKSELRLTTNRIDAPAAVRRAQFQGREHLVFPAVMLREQVLHCMNCEPGGEFIPLSAIEESLPGWEGRPVTILRHPTENGQSVSANSREILERDVVGRVFDPRVENEALKADVWLDITATRRLVGGATLIERIENGEMLEVSTGYYRKSDNTPGKHNGESYVLTQHRILADHFAIGLKKGACSIHDGCGAPRINAEGESLTARVRAIEDAVFARNRDLEDANEEEEFWYPLDIYDDVVIVRQGGRLFEVSYTIGDDGAIAFGETMEVEVEYRSAQNAAGDEGILRRGARALVRLATGRREEGPQRPDHNEGGHGTAVTSNEESQMNRTATIAALAAAAIGFTAEELGAFSDERLTALSKLLPENEGEPGSEPAANKGGCGCQGKGDQPAVNSGEEGPASQGLQLAPEAIQSAVANAVRETLGADFSELKDFISNQKAAQDREKDEMVTRLAANERCPFEEAELKAFGAETLRKLEQSYRSASYVGLGGPRGDVGDDDVAPDPTPMLLEAVTATSGKEN